MTPALHAILVTYRRPLELAKMLDVLREAEAPPDRLVVVNNGVGDDITSVVHSRWPGPVEVVETGENLGPAGGIAKGMDVVQTWASGNDWVVLLDDDDPPTSRASIANLRAFAEHAFAIDPRVAAVGLGGPRWDALRGRFRMVAERETRGIVEVAYIGGNRLPMYRIAAVREVGVFQADLFFGFEELEYALRLNASGYYLAVPPQPGRGLDKTPAWDKPKLSAKPATWRDYYSMRNFIYVNRKYGRGVAAARYVIVAGLLKPIVNGFRRPTFAVRLLRNNYRAVVDGYRGRLGRTVEPLSSLGTQ